MILLQPSRKEAEPRPPSDRTGTGQIRRVVEKQEEEEGEEGGRDDDEGCGRRPHVVQSSVKN